LQAVGDNWIAPICFPFFLISVESESVEFASSIRFSFFFLELDSDPVRTVAVLHGFLLFFRESATACVRLGFLLLQPLIRFGYWILYG
jgi:hypothetical protein